MEAIGLPPFRTARSERVSCFWANAVNAADRGKLTGTQAPDT